MNIYVAMIIKLILAVMLGGIVGYEREHRSSPAGLRTHILVCIGAALIQITSLDYYHYHVGQYGDPMRLGAQVISGIGFLGAGTILKEGANIKGLTTAASIWSVACIGLAIGTGLYPEAIAATIFIYLSLEGLKKFERKMTREKRRVVIGVTLENHPGKLHEMGTMFEFMGISVSSVEIKKEESDILSAEFTVSIPSSIPNEKVMEKIMFTDGVMGIKFIR